MTEICVVFQSGGGHTKVLAEAVVRGLASVDGVNGEVAEIRREDIHSGRYVNEQVMSKLDAADGIIFGCATYGAAEVLWQVRNAHIPVAMVWTVLESAEHWLVVTIPSDWRKRLPCTNDELMKRIANNIFESKFGLMMPKILVMNDDVDPANTKEVVWALATRCHPRRGEVVFAGESTNPLVAFLSTAEKRSLNTSKTVYNCLPQEEFGDVMPTRSSFAHAYPRELQNKILANWCHYGFSD